MEKQKNKAVETEINDDALKNVSGGTETGTKCFLCGRELTNSICDRCDKLSLDELMAYMKMRVWHSEEERREALQAVKEKTNMKNNENKKAVPAVLDDDMLNGVVGGVGVAPLVQIENPDIIDPADMVDGYVLSHESGYIEK